MTYSFKKLPIPMCHDLSVLNYQCLNIMIYLTSNSCFQIIFKNKVLESIKYVTLNSCCSNFIHKLEHKKMTKHLKDYDKIYLYYIVGNQM